MRALSLLPWIPVFPLIGFLVNGLVYLALAFEARREGRSEGARTAPACSRADPRRCPCGSRVARRATAPTAATGHGGPRGRSPFARSTPSSARSPAASPSSSPSSRSAPGGPRRTERRRSWRPSGPGCRWGSNPTWFGDEGALDRRRVPSRRALGADALLRHLRRVAHPRLLGRLHGARPGLRALLLVPEPLHVRDADARPRREPRRSSSSGGRASASARTS